jgi:hypothetical protein
MAGEVGPVPATAAQAAGEAIPCEHAWISDHHPGHRLYWVSQCMLCHEADWDDLDKQIDQLAAHAAAAERAAIRQLALSEAARYDAMPPAYDLRVRALALRKFANLLRGPRIDADASGDTKPPDMPQPHPQAAHGTHRNAEARRGASPDMHPDSDHGQTRL